MRAARPALPICLASCSRQRSGFPAAPAMAEGSRHPLVPLRMHGASPINGHLPAYPTSGSPMPAAERSNTRSSRPFMLKASAVPDLRHSSEPPEPSLRSRVRVAGGSSSTRLHVSASRWPRPKVPQLPAGPFLLHDGMAALLQCLRSCKPDLRAASGRVAQPIELQPSKLRVAGRPLPRPPHASSETLISIRRRTRHNSSHASRSTNQSRS